MSFLKKYALFEAMRWNGGPVNFWKSEITAAQLVGANTDASVDTTTKPAEIVGTDTNATVDTSGGNNLLKLRLSPDDATFSTITLPDGVAVPKTDIAAAINTQAINGILVVKGWNPYAANMMVVATVDGSDRIVISVSRVYDPTPKGVYIVASPYVEVGKLTDGSTANPVLGFADNQLSVATDKQIKLVYDKIIDPVTGSGEYALVQVTEGASVAKTQIRDDINGFFISSFENKRKFRGWQASVDGLNRLVLSSDSAYVGVGSATACPSGLNAVLGFNIAGEVDDQTAPVSTDQARFGDALMIQSYGRDFPDLVTALLPPITPNSAGKQVTVLNAVENDDISSFYVQPDGTDAVYGHAPGAAVLVDRSTFAILESDGVEWHLQPPHDQPDAPSDANAILGVGAVAFGDGNLAEGDYSIAQGMSNYVAGWSAGVFGQANVVYAINGFAFGLVNCVASYAGFACGIANAVAGFTGFAAGVANAVYGNSAAGIGTENAAFGDFSVAFGVATVASGQGAVVGGESNAASGDASTVFGLTSATGHVPTSFTMPFGGVKVTIAAASGEVEHFFKGDSVRIISDNSANATVYDRIIVTDPVYDNDTDTLSFDFDSPLDYPVVSPPSGCFAPVPGPVFGGYIVDTTIASFAHAAGLKCHALGEACHVEGAHCTAYGSGSHAGGVYGVARHAGASVRGGGGAFGNGGAQAGRNVLHCLALNGSTEILVDANDQFFEGYKNRAYRFKLSAVMAENADPSTARMSYVREYLAHQEEATGMVVDLSGVATVLDPGALGATIAAGPGGYPKGRIEAVDGATLVDGENIVLDDGTHIVTFEFDDDGSVIPSPTLYPVNFTAGDTAGTVANAIAAAINQAQVDGNLDMVAVVKPGSVVELAETGFSVAGGDNAITTTSACTVAGMWYDGLILTVTNPPGVDLRVVAELEWVELDAVSVP